MMALEREHLDENFLSFIAWKEGGGMPLPDFFWHFFKKCILESIKGVYFFQNANVFNFELFFGLFTYLGYKVHIEILVLNWLEVFLNIQLHIWGILWGLSFHTEYITEMGEGRKITLRQNNDYIIYSHWLWKLCVLTKMIIMCHLGTNAGHMVLLFQVQEAGAPYNSKGSVNTVSKHFLHFLCFVAT